MNMEEISRLGNKKRKLITLTNIQKKELCKYKADNPSKSYEEVGKKFGVGKSTVGDIIIYNNHQTCHVLNRAGWQTLKNETILKNIINWEKLRVRRFINYLDFELSSNLSFRSTI